MTNDAGGAAPLDLCFLGCGWVTERHTRTLAHFAKEVRLHYASRDRGRAMSFAKRFGGGYCGSYAEALDDPKVDAVLIATPPVNHLELACAALTAGKHVIVEKPAFLRSSDVQIVRQMQKTAGRRVLVAENYCYKPLLARLRQLIKGGAVGEVLFVHVNALKQQTTGNWRDDPGISGGGALFEGGIHWINFLANLGLTIRSVRGHRPGRPTGLDRSMLVSIEYAEGPVGALFYSWEVPTLFRGLRLSRISGRAGSITFESNGLIVLTRGRRVRLAFPGLLDISGYRAMFRNFIDTLRLGREPRMTLEQAERDLMLVESVYASLSQP